MLNAKQKENQILAHAGIKLAKSFPICLNAFPLPVLPNEQLESRYINAETQKKLYILPVSNNLQLYPSGSCGLQMMLLGWDNFLWGWRSELWGTAFLKHHITKSWHVIISISWASALICILLMYSTDFGIREMVSFMAYYGKGWSPWIYNHY